MKTIIIDTPRKVIYESSIGDNILEWRDVLSCPPQRCDGIAAVQLHPREILWVDDEGLLKRPLLPLFEILGYHQPIAGKGLILGNTTEGDAVSTRFPVEIVRELITWRDDIELSHFTQEEGKTKVHGIEAWYIQRTPVFVPKEKKS